MTTERTSTSRRPAKQRAAPVVGLSPLEWRLWLTAALAGGYALVWLALAPSSAPASEAASKESQPRTEPQPDPAVRQVEWIANLPPKERPVVVIPDGWTLDTSQLTTGSMAVARQAPRVTRVRSSRPNRVRTRSS